MEISIVRSHAWIHVKNFYFIIIPWLLTCSFDTLIWSLSEGITDKVLDYSYWQFQPASYIYAYYLHKGSRIEPYKYVFTWNNENIAIPRHFQSNILLLYAIRLSRHLKM